MECSPSESSSENAMTDPDLKGLRPWSPTIALIERVQREDDARWARGELKLRVPRETTIRKHPDPVVPPFRALSMFVHSLIP